MPSALEQIRCVLSIPTKKTDVRLVQHLTAKEMQSILDVPDLELRVGIRDRAMLHLCFAVGLKVPGLIGIRVVDVRLQPEPSVLIHGKGRRDVVFRCGKRPRRQYGLGCQYEVRSWRQSYLQMLVMDV